VANEVNPSEGDQTTIGKFEKPLDENDSFGPTPSGREGFWNAQKKKSPARGGKGLRECPRAGGVIQQNGEKFVQRARRRVTAGEKREWLTGNREPEKKVHQQKNKTSKERGFQGKVLGGGKNQRGRKGKGPRAWGGRDSEPRVKHI